MPIKKKNCSYLWNNRSRWGLLSKIFVKKKLHSTWYKKKELVAKHIKG